MRLEYQRVPPDKPLFKPATWFGIWSAAMLGSFASCYWIGFAGVWLAMAFGLVGFGWRCFKFVLWGTVGLVGIYASWDTLSHVHQIIH